MGGALISRTARGMWCSCKSGSKYFIIENRATTLVSRSPPFAASGTRELPSKSSFTGHQSPGGLQQQSLRSARFPIGVRSISSMMPKHDATAAARLVSRLSSDLTPEAEGMLRHYVSPI